ncbi:DUF3486 family protein [Rhizobium sp. 9140]|uniref:DUF3486 family protein n=1 Tax=Rhizobium sp. 9140 TaxID=1761900 RepID=UPI00079180AA|nr:DUF3486 family protein [Rhizobium sp. 9140]CZT32977.1 Protein of unknown function (DUF3486) [Rhizobium sp. 9140]CZT36373.1 Protein of unknown function (DUF3486) [Rhizobium sp. 9140]
MRSRLSGIELLPEECASIVAKAAADLQDRDRTQIDIYQDFFAELEALKREHRGELEFTIPSFSAFNRYSIKLATLSNRLNQTREIAATIAEKWDAKSSDDLTLIAAEAIKTLIFELLTNAGEAGLDPKGAMALANALRAASQAQGVSTARRQKVEADFASKAEEAVKLVQRSKGLSDETASEILDQILGVGTK